MQFDGRIWILSHLANLKAMYNSPKVDITPQPKEKVAKKVPYRNDAKNMRRKMIEAAGGIRQFNKLNRNLGI